jgi:hypothetical protein
MSSIRPPHWAWHGVNTVSDQKQVCTESGRLRALYQAQGAGPCWLLDPFLIASLDNRGRGVPGKRKGEAQGDLLGPHMPVRTLPRAPSSQYGKQGRCEGVCEGDSSGSSPLLAVLLGECGSWPVPGPSQGLGRGQQPQGPEMGMLEAGLRVGPVLSSVCVGLFVHVCYEGVYRPVCACAR